MPPPYTPEEFENHVDSKIQEYKNELRCGHLELQSDYEALDLAPWRSFMGYSHKTAMIAAQQLTAVKKNMADLSKDEIVINVHSLSEVSCTASTRSVKLTKTPAS